MAEDRGHEEHRAHDNEATEQAGEGGAAWLKCRDYNRVKGSVKVCVCVCVSVCVCVCVWPRTGVMKESANTTNMQLTRPVRSERLVVIKRSVCKDAQWGSNASVLYRCRVLYALVDGHRSPPDTTAI